MKIIQAGRRFGKTVRLVAWVKQGKPLPVAPYWTRVLLCIVSTERQRLIREYGLDENQVYTIDSTLWGQNRAGVPVEVAIDNADHLFRKYLNGSRLAVISVDDDEELYLPQNDRGPKFYPSERPNEIEDGRNMPDLRA